MATVSVENNQYKTYPDTYPTRAEAEEALASLVLSKLGKVGFCINTTNHIWQMPAYLFEFGKFFLWCSIQMHLNPTIQRCSDINWLRKCYLLAYAIKRTNVLGINNEEEGASVKEAKNLLEYGQRVVELLGILISSLQLWSSTDFLGGRSNGVWSHQVESEYHDKHGEKLPANWIEKLEEINQIRIESPIPDSIR